MELSEQQELYDSIKKLIGDKARGKEYCLLVGVETGKIASGECLFFTVTTLGDYSSLGSWKGLLNSMNKLHSKLSEAYFNLTSPSEDLPIKPK